MINTANINAHKKQNVISVACVALMLALSVLACLFAPNLAFASEGSSGLSAIIPNPIEFFPMLVAFILLCIILGKFGWPMFNGMLEKREKSIRDALEQSENAKVEAEKVLQDYKKQLEEAKAESAEILANARSNAESLEADLKRQAEAQAEEIIEKAKISIEAEKKAAISELQSSIADMSIDVASKLIANDLSDDEHRKIIENYVAQAGSFK